MKELICSTIERNVLLKCIRDHVQPWQRVFVGVIDPLNPKVETPEEVCARVLEAAKYIPVEQLGTTDDCGFSPFDDDQSTLDIDFVLQECDFQSNLVSIINDGDDIG